MKYVGNSTNPNNPAWNEYVDKDGISTLQEHRPKEVWRACKKHYFVAIDPNGNVQCRTCGYGQHIVWGPDTIVRGRIVRRKTP